jgi:hypothetical protein
MIQRVFTEVNIVNQVMVHPYRKEKIIYVEDGLVISQLYSIKTLQLTNEFAFYLKINLKPILLEMIYSIYETLHKNGIYSGNVFRKPEFNFCKIYQLSPETHSDEVFNELMIELNSMQATIQKSINTVLSNSPQTQDIWKL